jgi:hypothetical protein
VNKISLYIISIIIILGILFIFPYVNNNKDIGLPKILLQFEATWHHQPKKEYFEFYIDPNMRHFTKIKDIDKPVDFNSYSKRWLGTFSVELLIKSIGLQGDPVDIIDISPNKNYVCVKYREFTNKLSIPNTYVLYLIDLKSYRVLNKVDTPECSGYFTKDSNSFLYQDVLEISEMNLLSQQTITFGDSHSFFMLPGKNSLLNFKDGKISLIDLNNGTTKNVGRYSNLVSESGLINDKWAYFITYRDPKGGGYNLYFINLENYKKVQYPYRFQSASLIRVIPMKNSESEADKKKDNNSI